jgi:hypothetical protein
LFVGGGASRLDRPEQAEEQQPLFQLDSGFGSSPSYPVSVGWLGRVSTHFGDGTDLALLLRGATQGFVLGNWGGALDLGAYQRWWGADATGLMGSLVLGAPWGVTASVTAAFGNDDAQTYSAAIGIDLARLTIYRLSGESWWENPYPAYRPGEEN